MREADEVPPAARENITLFQQLSTALHECTLPCIPVLKQVMHISVHELTGGNSLFYSIHR